MNRRIKKLLALAVGVPTFAVALVGLGHTPAARPLLAKLGFRYGCPVNVDNVTPKALEEQRVAQMRQMRGDKPAAAHPALRFQLDQSTKAQVLAWSHEQNVACVEELKGAALRCTAVREAALEDAEIGAPIDDVFLRFEPGGKLVGMDVMRLNVSLEQAVRVVDGTSTRLTADVGPPTSTEGTATPDYIGSEPFRRVGFQYRFSNYAADISATNLANRGVVVREQYWSIPD